MKKVLLLFSALFLVASSNAWKIYSHDKEYYVTNYQAKRTQGIKIFLTTRQSRALKTIRYQPNETAIISWKNHEVFIYKSNGETISFDAQTKQLIRHRLAIDQPLQEENLLDV